MVAMASIEEFGRRIGREFGAERVILFGSHAHRRESARADSDGRRLHAGDSGRGKGAL